MFGGQETWNCRRKPVWIHTGLICAGVPCVGVPALSWGATARVFSSGLSSVCWNDSDLITDDNECCDQIFRFCLVWLLFFFFTAFCLVELLTKWQISFWEFILISTGSDGDKVATLDFLGLSVSFLSADLRMSFYWLLIKIRSLHKKHLNAVTKH